MQFLLFCLLVGCKSLCLPLCPIANFLYLSCLFYYFSLFTLGNGTPYIPAICWYLYTSISSTIGDISMPKIFAICRGPHICGELFPAPPAILSCYCKCNSSSM